MTTTPRMCVKHISDIVNLVFGTRCTPRPYITERRPIQHCVRFCTIRYKRIQNTATQAGGIVNATSDTSAENMHSRFIIHGRQRRRQAGRTFLIIHNMNYFVFVYVHSYFAPAAILRMMYFFENFSSVARKTEVQRCCHHRPVALWNFYCFIFTRWRLRTVCCPLYSWNRVEILETLAVTLRGSFITRSLLSL